MGSDDEKETDDVATIMPFERLRTWTNIPDRFCGKSRTENHPLKLIMPASAIVKSWFSCPQVPLTSKYWSPPPAGVWVALVQHKAVVGLDNIKRVRVVIALIGNRPFRYRRIEIISGIWCDRIFKAPVSQKFLGVCRMCSQHQQAQASNQPAQYREWCQQICHGVTSPSQHGPDMVIRRRGRFL